MWSQSESLEKSNFFIWDIMYSHFGGENPSQEMNNFNKINPAVTILYKPFLIKKHGLVKSHI